jgi:prophage regulatory protein
MDQGQKPRILRRRQVEAQTGLSRSAIYEGVARGTFPRSIHIGTRAVGWLAEEIDAWIAARIAESRSRSAKTAMVAAKPEASGPSILSKARATARGRRP